MTGREPDRFRASSYFATEAVRRTAETYCKALWSDADVQVEVWIEKEARAGIVLPVLKQEHGTLDLSAFVQIRSAIPSGPGVILENPDRLLVTHRRHGRCRWKPSIGR